MADKPSLMTTTLWDFPSQQYGDEDQGDQDYRGATPSYIIWNLLQRYTQPKDLIIDPMAGSGTTLDVARDLGRRALGYDLQATRADIFHCDARTLPLEDEKADFVFIDPPYSTHLEYSGDERCIGELDAATPAYFKAMTQVVEEIDRILRPGHYMALYVSDSYRKGKPFCTIGFDLFAILRRHFEPVDIVTVVRRNSTLLRHHWHTSAVEGNYYLRGFNYLFIMRKPDEGEGRPGRTAQHHARPAEPQLPRELLEFLPDHFEPHAGGYKGGYKGHAGHGEHRSHGEFRPKAHPPQGSQREFNPARPRRHGDYLPVDPRDARPAEGRTEPGAFRPRREEGSGESRSFKPRRTEGPGESRSFKPRRTEGPGESRGFKPRRTEEQGEGRNFEPRRPEGRGEARDFRPRRTEGPGESRGFKPRRTEEQGEGRNFEPRRPEGYGEARDFRPRRAEGHGESRGFRPRRSEGRPEPGSFQPRRISGPGESRDFAPKRHSGPSGGGGFKKPFRSGGRSEGPGGSGRPEGRSSRPTGKGKSFKPGRRKK